MFVFSFTYGTLRNMLKDPVSGELVWSHVVWLLVFFIVGVIAFFVVIELYSSSIWYIGYGIAAAVALTSAGIVAAVAAFIADRVTNSDK